MVAKELHTEMLVEGKSKAEVKAVLFQALAERYRLKGTIRARSRIRFGTATGVKKIGIGRKKVTERV